MGCEYVIWQREIVDQGIICEQAAVYEGYLHLSELPARVHDTEEPLEERPDVSSVGIVKRFCRAALQEVADELGREQHPLAHVLAIEREDEPVENLLGEPEQIGRRSL